MYSSSKILNTKPTTAHCHNTQVVCPRPQYRQNQYICSHAECNNNVMKCKYSCERKIVKAGTKTVMRTNTRSQHSIAVVLEPAKTVRAYVRTCVYTRHEQAAYFDDTKVFSIELSEAHRLGAHLIHLVIADYCATANLTNWEEWETYGRRMDEKNLICFNEVILPVSNWIRKQQTKSYFTLQWILIYRHRHRHTSIHEQHRRICIICIYIEIGKQSTLARVRACAHQWRHCFVSLLFSVANTIAHYEFVSFISFSFTSTDCSCCCSGCLFSVSFVRLLLYTFCVSAYFELASLLSRESEKKASTEYQWSKMKKGHSQ